MELGFELAEKYETSLQGIKTCSQYNHEIINFFSLRFILEVSREAFYILNN